MLGPEQINLFGYSRLPNIEGINIRIHEVVARQLGLTDGQIVQGVVETRGELLKLLLNGQSFDVPHGLRYQHGDMPYFRVQPSGNGKALHPVRGGESAPANAGSRDAAHDALPSRLACLLARPPAMTFLLALLPPRVLQHIAAQLPPGGAFEQISELQPSLRALTPGAIEQTIARSGLWSETQLAQGHIPVLDLKQWLRQMQGTLPVDSALQPALAESIDDIEAAQLDALKAQFQKELSFGVVIPFADAPPLALKMRRDAPSRDVPTPPIQIDLHGESDTHGPFWLKLVMRTELAPEELSVSLWSAHPDYCRWAEESRPDLTARLAESGLHLASLTVFNAPRPEPRERVAVPGSVVDLDA